MSGLLIAFEGGDGSGKSTQSSVLATRLDAVLTRQAGGTAFGTRVRALTLDSESADLSPRAEAMLYMADRAEHVDKVVRPALDAGRHVVTDRWAYSSMVYQGFGRGLDIESLRSISDWAMEGLWPDVVVLLDIPLDLGSTRLSSRTDSPDHYELAGASLQARVLDGYRSLAAADPDRWCVVDGVGQIDEVAARVWDAVLPFVSGVSGVPA